MKDWPLVKKKKKKKPNGYHSTDSVIIQMVNLTFVLDQVGSRSGIQI